MEGRSGPSLAAYAPGSFPAGPEVHSGASATTPEEAIATRFGLVLAAPSNPHQQNYAKLAACPNTIWSSSRKTFGPKRSDRVDTDWDCQDGHQKRGRQDGVASPLDAHALAALLTSVEDAPADTPNPEPRSVQFQLRWKFCCIRLGCAAPPVALWCVGQRGPRRLHGARRSLRDPRPYAAGMTFAF